MNMVNWTVCKTWKNTCVMLVAGKDKIKIYLRIVCPYSKKDGNISKYQQQLVQNTGTVCDFRNLYFPCF